MMRGGTLGSVYEHHHGLSLYLLEVAAAGSSESATSSILVQFAKTGLPLP